MKFVFIFGPGAIGKMTVGQELSKITDLKLMHNHQMIEPVIDIFGYFNINCILDLRDVIFEHFALSDEYGLIFTMMFNFNESSQYEYIDRVKNIFNSLRDDMEYFFVELKAPLEERLKRNETFNRLENKPSKRNIEVSNLRLKLENEIQRPTT